MAENHNLLVGTDSRPSPNCIRKAEVPLSSAVDEEPDLRAVVNRRVTFLRPPEDFFSLSLSTTDESFFTSSWIAASF